MFTLYPAMNRVETVVVTPQYAKQEGDTTLFKKKKKVRSLSFMPGTFGYMKRPKSSVTRILSLSEPKIRPKTAYERTRKILPDGSQRGMVKGSYVSAELVTWKPKTKKPSVQKTANGSCGWTNESDNNI